MKLFSRNKPSVFRVQSKLEFEQLFREHYGSLCAYANNFLKDTQAAEDVAQEVLMKLWTGRETLEITTSVQAYLFRAVRNASLNLLKHIEVREDYKTHNEAVIKEDEQALSEEVIVSELEGKIRQAIDKLPIERKKVFVMSRYDGLKYKEIAEKLGISIKTVENQMGKALKFLREELVDYIPLLLIFFEDFFHF